MHPLVRDLYRRFLHVGKDYPKGLSFVRDKARAAFLANKDLADEEQLMRAIYKGRWWVNELIGVVKLKKYRAMKQRYNDMSVAAAAADALETKLDAATRQAKDNLR